MFEKFTDGAKRVIVVAVGHARALHHDYIGSEHLFLAVSGEIDQKASDVLADEGLTADEVEQKVMTLISRGETMPMGHIPFTAGAKHALEQSQEEASQLGHKYIYPEHILLALMRENEGIVMEALTGLGADIEGVRNKIRQTL